MTNAAAPMIGGMICPPLEATDSKAPAVSSSSPCRFSRGMVNAPVVAALAAALPLIDPMPRLATTVICASPDLMRRPTIVPSWRK